MVCNNRLNISEKIDSKIKNPISQLFWNSKNNIRMIESWPNGSVDGIWIPGSDI